MVRNAEDKWFQAFSYIVLGIVGLVAVVPMLYVLSVSLTPFAVVLKQGGYVLFPQELTFNAYRKLIGTSTIPRSLGVTVYVTVVGTAINLLLTTLVAYPLSRKQLPGRNVFLLMVVITLLFSGGIIPTYLVVKATGLIDSLWALILPTAVSSFNVLIMKSFFEQLPEELFESARIDGAKEFGILFRLAVPLSLPVMITVGLFYAVGHWNSFFAAIMYVTDRSLYPLQVVVREILMLSQQPLENAEDQVPTVTMQMAAVMFASLPIIVVYPFLQKHFTKGMLLGSIKG
ncbi:carbohydrate ABC transporter permease [Paenibacillus contaminans]|jgi:putative aldouronate transport system permease protein|uniref:ABC transporter permease n=1 Tax=Paenibacillus contaminans TaxID=450362 RepID=A0A329MNV7_9BACL|nr:carbohydrate ABC transporter permease [Paenibacillus contaminans]RAV19597.1 ABC transporter permease [Paenibacillus contaminans]